MNHNLKRIYEGKGESGSITPTCSCGWKGDPVFRYNDYQQTIVRNQESQHIRFLNQLEAEVKGYYAVKS